MSTASGTRRPPFRRRNFWLGAAVYIGFMAVLARQSYLPTRYEFDGTGWFLGLSIAGIAVTLLMRDRPVARGFYVLPVVLVILALVSYPSTSRDPFRYLFDGEIIRLWHMSPYTHLPVNLPVDQYSRMFQSTWWASIPSPYGPLWEGLMAAVNWLSRNQLWAGLIWLKLIGVAAWLVCGRYIFLITKKAWLSYIWLINPIVLINTVHTPHTDVVMTALLLGAYYHAGRPARSGLIGAAALVKAHALIFAPFLVRRGREWLWTGMAIAGVLVVGCVALAPVVHLTPAAMLWAGVGGSVTGANSLLFHNLLPGVNNNIVFLASYGLFILAYATVAVAFWKRRISAVGALALTSLLVPLCLTGLLYPWHFILPIACLLLSGSALGLEAVLLITLVGFIAPMSVLGLLIFAGGMWVVRACLRRVSPLPAVISWL